MIKTNDWIKSGTSNAGDETRYTLRSGHLHPCHVANVGEASEAR